MKISGVAIWKSSQRYAAVFGVIASLAVVPDAHATINVGSTTVTSIGHYFTPPEIDPFGVPRPGYVTDFLVNQTQEVGGGAALPNVAVDLDSDTSVSYSLAAPLGKHFLVDVPVGASASLDSYIVWKTPGIDGGGSVSFDLTFQNLTGVPPALANSSAVGDGNQFFTFTTGGDPFSNDLTFDSLTMTTTYAPRNLGLGVLDYTPFGYAQYPGTTTNDAGFVFYYATDALVDPGRFVFIVPEPATVTLWTSGCLSLIVLARRRQRIALSFKPGGATRSGGGHRLIRNCPTAEDGKPPVGRNVVIAKQDLLRTDRCHPVRLAGGQIDEIDPRRQLSRHDRPLGVARNCVGGDPVAVGRELQLANRPGGATPQAVMPQIERFMESDRQTRRDIPHEPCGHCQRRRYVRFRVKPDSGRMADRNRSATRSASTHQFRLSCDTECPNRYRLL